MLECLPALPQAQPAPSTAVAPAANLVPAAYQTDSQRAAGNARQAVLRAVQRLQEAAGVTQRRAMLTLLTQAAAGQLASDVAAAMLTLARDSRGRKAANGTGLPSLRTLQGWLARANEAQEQGQTDNLAPRQRNADMTLQPWMVLAVELKRRPQKPTTKLVWRQLHDAWPQFSVQWVRKEAARNGKSAMTDVQAQHLAAQLVVPSYGQMTRFFGEKFSNLDLLQGQHLGSKLRSHKFYQHRTAAGLEPATEVHADGWATHFTAPHPINGEYVTYEVWHFHDVATRYMPPFAIGMSESTEVILKGLENCIRELGVPAIWQTDSTGAVKNKKLEFDPAASLSARIGMTIVHPQEVGNSQANGICENYNTTLDREARALTTYQHPQRMDSLAYKQIRKFTNQMVKAAKAGKAEVHQSARSAAQRVGKGILFETSEQAVLWLNEVRVRHNNTPHKSLPKITDPATGARRHMTPQESLDAARAAGWQPVAMDEATLIKEFRPHFRKTIRRETVSPYAGQRYYHADLGQYNGEEVMVAADIMDGRTVWVKDMQGRLLCEATFVEATGYRCRSLYEISLERRMNAQIKRKEQDIEDIEARMNPANAPLDVPAIELQTATVLPGVWPAPAHAPVPKDDEPIDFALRFYGGQADAKERERQEQHDAQRPTDDDSPRSYMELLARQYERAESEGDEFNEFGEGNGAPHEKDRRSAS